MIHLMERELTKGGSTLFFNFQVYTLFSCIKIVHSCGYVGLSGLAVQNSRSNCLVLMLHIIGGNFRGCNDRGHCGHDWTT